jgi:hypothetical protein
MFALGVVGGALLAVAWSLATPVGSAPDEPAHIAYAYGVATGQTLPGTERVRVKDGVPDVTVAMPSALLDYPDPECYWFKAATPAYCGPDLPPGTGTETTTYMVRYPPLYYAVVGTVIRFGMWAGMSGLATLTLTRVLSALLCVAVVAGASALLFTRYASRAVATAALVACTPMVVWLFGTINPNGFEVAAAIASAAAVVAVRHDAARGRVVRPWLQIVLVVSLLVLAFSRPLSVAWAGLLALTLFLRAGAVRPAALLGWATRIVLVLGLAGASVWLLYASRFRGSDVGVGTTWADASVPERVGLILLRFGDMIWEAGGSFGWADTYPATILLVAGLVVPTVLLTGQIAGGAPGRPTVRLALYYLLAGAGVVAVHSYVAAYGWQGRYVLPVVAAAVVLCVPAMRGDALGAGSVRRLVVRCSAGLLFLQVAILLWNMWRYVYGVDYTEARLPPIPLVMETARWTPVVGQVTIVLVAVLGVCLLGAAIASTVPRRAERAVPGPVSGEPS